MKISELEINILPIIYVLLIGAAIRTIFLFDYYNNPIWNHLLVDSLFHHRWAISISEGNIWGQEAFFRAPLYIYLLGAIYNLFGQSILVARLLGLIIGLLSVYVTYLLALKIFNKKTALVAALLHALYPIIIYFESELLVDILFTLFAQLSILILFKANENKEMKWFAVTGLLIGLAAITRPIILGLVPIYISWIIFTNLNNKKRIVQSCLSLIITMLAIISPVTIRNAIVADDFVLISSSGGINFYLGNNPFADGFSAAMPPPNGNSWELKDIRYLAEQDLKQPLSESDISQYWYSQGWKWILENKITFLKLYFKKLYYSINNFEASNNRNLSYTFKEFSVINHNPLGFGLIFPLALLSLIILYRQKVFNPKILFIILYIAFYLLLISAFFINARFRLPVIPIVIILCAYAVLGISADIKRKHYRALFIQMLLPAIFFFGLSNYNLFGIKKQNSNSGNYNLGNYNLYQSKYDEAKKYFHLTLSENKKYKNANLNLGAIFMRTGQTDSAEYYFRKELDYHPNNSKAFSNLASLFFIKEDYIKAIDYAQTAIKCKPYFSDPYLILIRVGGITNDTTLFYNAVQKGLDNLDNRIDLFYEIAMVHTHWKQYLEAINYLEQADNTLDTPIEVDDMAMSYSQKKSKRARVAYQLGYLYGIKGTLELSEQMSAKAISLDSNLVEAYINIANVYISRGEQTKALNYLLEIRRKFPQNQILNQIIDALQ